MNIDVNDAVTTSENFAIQADPVDISVSELVLVLEGGTLFDSVSTSESVPVLGLVNISTSDSVSTSEFIGQYPDTAYVLENIEVLIINPFSPQPRDTVIVSESVQVKVPQNPFAQVWNNIIRIRKDNF